MPYINKCIDYSVRCLLFIMELVLGTICLYYEWIAIDNIFNTYISSGWFILITIYQLVIISLTFRSLGHIQFDFSIDARVQVAEIIWYLIGIFYSIIYLANSVINTLYLFILVVSVVNLFYYMVIYLCNNCYHKATHVEESIEESIEDTLLESHELEGGTIIIQNDDNLGQYEVIPIADENLDDELCSICLESHANGIITTICNHQYHFKCLIRWLNIDATCPECRTPIRLRGIVE